MMHYPETGRVLIQCADVLENMQRVLPLAETLRLRGMVPILLTYSSDTGSFFSSRGFETVALNPYRERVKRRHVKLGKLPKEFFADESFDIINASRTIDPVTHSDAESTIYAVRQIGVALQRLIKDRKIDWLITWNGVTGPTAIAMRLIGKSRNMSAGFMERGMLPGSLFYDVRGTNGASTLADGLTRVYSNIDVAKARARKRLEVGLFTTPYVHSRSEKERIIFLPLQVQTDSNILLYSSRIKTMRQLVFQAVELATDLGNNWRVVVRDHPEEIESHLNLPIHPLVERDNISQLDDMLERSAIVMTINSTVGLTAALRGSIVVCHGQGIYSNEPFILRAHDHNQMGLADAVRAALDKAPDMEACRNFAALLFDYHIVVPSDQALTDNSNVLRHFGSDSPATVARLTTPLERVRTNLQRHAKQGSPIPLCFRLSFREKIVKTYRIQEEVNPRNYLDTISELFPGVSFTFQHPYQQAPPENTVLVLPAGKISRDSTKFLAVLDEFGYPHMGCNHN